MAYVSEIRSQKKEETRRAIIAAAVGLFMKQGTEAPSLDSICAAAGCTRGAFYVHFTDREDLIVAAMDEVMGGFVGQLMGADGDAFIDTFLEAVSRRDVNVGGGSLRFRHVLDACARYPQVRERYLRLLTGAQMALLARMPQDGEAVARTQLLVLVAMGLMASVDLGREVDLASLRPLIHRLAKVGTPQS